MSLSPRAHAELGHVDDAWRCIGEAMTAIETTKERWCEAELNRTAGEIARNSKEPDATKAETYFERALTVARQQQAKSWELRAAMNSRGSGVTRARRSKRANCWLRFMGGSLRASTRSI